MLAIEGLFKASRAKPTSPSLAAIRLIRVKTVPPGSKPKIPDNSKALRRTRRSIEPRDLPLDESQIGLRVAGRALHHRTDGGRHVLRQEGRDVQRRHEIVTSATLTENSL
jgi:hypothetical protein